MISVHPLTAAFVLGALANTAHAGVCFTWNGVGVNTLNFTVDAVNTTLPNTNKTGSPLGWGLALGPVAANGSWWLTNPAYDPIYNSIDDNTLSLTDGVLSEAYPVVFKSAPVSSGSALMTANTDELKGAAPEDSYCVVASPQFGQRPKLAVKGHHDLFSICHYDPGEFGQAVVIFNGTSVPGAYANVDAACYKVDLYVNALQ
ncbi:hypothetical protein OE88DRAFT_1732621 [Heliocybe sulcata]|uniref:Uncharacterized protein n=1 Tax=Heliocybe sulcata TaxID=5364 RepID=A0A5C3N9X1_9AGAM|nr:hypothetical protein OE88DRAFT_1732621 [Heliocybe sulcata]